MKRNLLLILLLCSTLLNAQNRPTPWQEVDTLIVQGHYTTAYKKCETLFTRAKRKGESHDMLKAIYKQHTAAASYQENHIENAIKAYQKVIPLLDGADKAFAYMLLAEAFEDYKNHNTPFHTTASLQPLNIESLCSIDTEVLSQWDAKHFDHAWRLCFEAARTESEALQCTRVEDYDLLIQGDSAGLRLRPTLYDVIMHRATEGMQIVNLKSSQYELLWGTSEEFLSLRLPHEASSRELWQIRQLQELTLHHAKTSDIQIRAHIDLKRIRSLRPPTYSSLSIESYTKGLERIAGCYRSHPDVYAMFLYELATLHFPNIFEHSDKESLSIELKKAERMEQLIEEIREIAPLSEWAQLGDKLYLRATHPYLMLQDHTTILPKQEGGINLTYRNASDITYRIVPRHADEAADNSNYREIIKRKPIGEAHIKIPFEHLNPYKYEIIALPLPPLEAGDYFIIAQNEESTDDIKSTSISAISVSNLRLSIMLNEAKREYIGMALNATTGEAVRDCEITLVEKSDKSLHLVNRFDINEEGYFIVPLPTGKYRKLYLRASDGMSHATYSFRYADFSDHRYWERVDESAQTSFTILTDRYTYEPGDTIHFGLIAYNHNKNTSLVKERLHIDISLEDTRGRTIASRQVLTDDWGFLTNTFIIPEDITTGNFRLRATNSVDHSSTYYDLNVEAFKAPTFQVTLERPQEPIRLGDSLILRGTSTTFTQMPVSGAQVTYSITATDINLFKGLPSPSSHFFETSGTTITDGEGFFYITIPVDSLDTTEERSTLNYIVTAHVTDTNGETQAAQTNFLAGHRTKCIDFATPTTLREGDSIRYCLRSLNGERTTGSISLQLSKLKVPHTTNILPTTENDIEHWDTERIYFHLSEHTHPERDNHIVLTKDMPYGFYRLTATYTDNDKPYSEDFYFELWGEGKNTVSSHALYLTRTDRDKVQTGDTATLYVGTRHSDVHLHYYIKVEDMVVDKGTLYLNDEMIPLRIPIKKEWRNTMRVDLVSIKNNVRRTDSHHYTIEDASSRLDIRLTSLDNNLEPGKEQQCTISVKDHLGKPIQSSLIISIYDASLDSYGQNYWDILPSPAKWGRMLETEDINLSNWSNNTYPSTGSTTAPRFYALPEGSRSRKAYYSLAAPQTRRQATNGIARDEAAIEKTKQGAATNDLHSSISLEQGEAKIQSHHLRQNLNHTAIFIPSLRTDEKGLATFTFTAPDLLTRWHVKGLAYVKDLRHGHINLDFVTRKALMIQPHAPRFLYEGDRCDFTAKVSNSGEETMDVWVELSIDGEIQSQEISLSPNSSASVSFPIIAPEKKNCVAYHISARSLTHSDAEQATITILPRRALVTETISLFNNGNEQRDFLFESLANNNSKTLEHKSLSLCVVPNPIWYAIEALQPLSEEDNPSIERLFQRYYAATMARHLIERYPEVQGHSEFFHAESLTALSRKLMSQLAACQENDGGWAWMKGFSSDHYTTLLIAKGLGELEAMGCQCTAQDDSLYTMTKQCINYQDKLHTEEFNNSQKKPEVLGNYILYYLYARSMFPEIPFAPQQDKAYRYYTKLLLRSSATYGTLMQKALKMLTLIRLSETKKAKKVAKVVIESALNNDEMGTYWRDNTSHWSWDTSPIATQALLIEAFTRLEQSKDIIGRMQQWLLKQKQTTQWDNSIATAQAVHALILSAPEEKALTTSSDGITITIGGQPITSLPADSTKGNEHGIIQRQWEAKDIHPAQAKVTIAKERALPAWGDLIWQYYEDADKIQSSGTGMSLTVTYYKVELENGKEILTAITRDSQSITKGDRIRACIHFTTDRSMDYLKLHISRPAALEPTSTHSGYAYHNGLAHYRSIEDKNTTFYIPHIAKGSYLLECDHWVSQSGHYICGASTIQCMYAPAFIATATSQTIQVK